jgi:signal transduction histidine kinase
LRVLGDAPRLEQILLNLIDNAIKFTARGSVSVAVAVAEESLRDVLLRFEVRDTGIGIEPADQRRIFNLFEQADGSTTRAYGGTGLGLALCKQLIGLMGGAIGVESKLGGGSVFWFTVRLRKPDDTSP